MRRILPALLALALAAGAAPALAAVEKGAFEVSPFLGWYQFDDGQLLDHSTAVGLRAGYNFSRLFALEGVLGLVPGAAGLEGSPDNDVNLMGGELLYHFTPDRQLVPFLAAGLMRVGFDPRVEGDDGRTVASLGGGVKMDLGRSFALRADVRYLRTVMETDRVNMLYTLGLAWAFGGAQSAPVAAPVLASPPPAAPAPPPTPVAAPPSSAPEPPPAPPAPPVLVIAPPPPPAPVDSDRDGVIDSLDKCPGTPANVKVNEVGCPVLTEERLSIALAVQFDTAQAVVKPQYHDELARVGDFMTKYPEVKGVIEGHTDSVGARDYNLALSQQRADAVRDYIVKNFGVAGDRLSAKGYGPDQPLADNKSVEGRAKNRRTVATFETVVKKTMTR